MKLPSLMIFLLLGGFSLTSCSKTSQNLYRLELERECIECNLEGVNLSRENLGLKYRIPSSSSPLSVTPFGLDKATPVNLTKANLANANFFQADLSGIILQEANLINANLSESDLEEAQLNLANLQGANLENANLQEANLENANLQGADLRGVNLQGANLENANLQGADLRGVNLEGTRLKGISTDQKTLWQEIPLSNNDVR